MTTAPAWKECPMPKLLVRLSLPLLAAVAACAPAVKEAPPAPAD